MQLTSLVFHSVITTGSAGGLSERYNGFIPTMPLKGPRKVCRLHFFLGLPLKGSLLCLLVLATRKWVNKFFQPYLVCYLIRCQLVSDILCYLLFIPSYCVHILWPKSACSHTYILDLYANQISSLLFPFKDLIICDTANFTKGENRP